MPDLRLVLTGDSPSRYGGYFNSAVSAFSTATRSIER
jgi:hypothetical protein